VTKALFSRGIRRGESGDTDGEMSDYTAVIVLPDAPADQVARALYNRGVSRGQAGDTDGEMFDYTTVIELPDAPDEPVTRALWARGRLRLRGGERDLALADFLDSARHTAALGRYRAEALLEAARLAEGEPTALAIAAKAAAEGLANLPREARIEQLIAMCQTLAVPELKEAWPRLMRDVLAGQPTGVVESLEFIEPVASVLESGDIRRLDPLPSEQREFALEVLKRFEPTESEAAGDPAVY
jgi:hypothetical protein